MIEATSILLILCYNKLMKKVVIVGGSGFIGSKLSGLLIKQGFSVVSVDKNQPSVSGVGFLRCSCEIAIPQDDKLKNPYAVVNLAGRSIQGPWNKEHKESIYSSRIKTTQNLVKLFKTPDFRPSVLVQASAVGFYGDRKEELLTEGSKAGDGLYLAHVAKDWELEASNALRYGVRTVIFRQGHVLGQYGFLGSLRPLYIKGLGGPVGSGDNWLPWIHVDDLLRLYLFAIKNNSISGIVNTVAPEVVRYREFSRLYARILQKPHLLHVPVWLFRFKYGDFADEITASQKVSSLRLWEFRSCIVFTTLKKALQDIENSK